MNFKDLAKLLPAVLQLAVTLFRRKPKDPPPTADEVFGPADQPSESRQAQQELREKTKRAADAVAR